MKFSTLTLFRSAILMACALIVGVALTEMLDAGPQQIQSYASMKRPEAMLALWLARAHTDAAANQLAAAFRIYAGLFTLSTILFAAAFWIGSAAHNEHRTRPTTLIAGLLIAQILIGACTESDLLYLVAAELGFIFPYRTALPWLGAQGAILGASFVPLVFVLAGAQAMCNLDDVLPPPIYLDVCTNYLRELALQGFAFCIGYFAGAEMRNRLALSAAHTELRAAQLLLGDAIRRSERGRISRNLHDVLGHHLSALNLQLDLALRHLGGKAAASAATASELARRLFSEIRVVVSLEHDKQIIDLRQALETLCRGIPTPRVSLLFDPALDIGSPALAHTIFRSVQEAISNAVRHSGADDVEIDIAKTSDGVTLAINDNGKGARKTKTERSGSGLHGIGERVAEHGGRLASGNRPGGGFGLYIWLPQTGVAV